MTWQPIETAPKDGAILVFFGNLQIPRYVTMNPNRVQAEVIEVAFCDDGDVCEAGTGHSMFEPWRGLEGKPTHWMPLPLAPEAKP